MPGGPDDHVLGDERVCAVCSVPLNYREPIGWHHPGALTPWDHPEVPVDPTELASINWRCDFCTNEHARWSLPANTFDTPTGDVSVGDWCVCDTCRPAVEARAWSTIVSQVRERFLNAGRPFDSGHEAYLYSLYHALELNITGPIYLNPPTARKESP